MITILLMVISYILGSIPNALWIGKVFKGIDIREHGSRNTGSTNAARVLGVKLGILTLILDISKGLLPTLIAILLKVDFFENLTKISNLDYVLVGICAIFGHVFSIFMNFKRWKGCCDNAWSIFNFSAESHIVCCNCVFCDFCYFEICFAVFDFGGHITSNFYIFFVSADNICYSRNFNSNFDCSKT